MILFELKNLSAGYKSGNVLHDIEMTVSRGDFIALIGPNGSGKSTLVSVFTGEIKPSGGKALIGGEEIRTIPAMKRARLFSVVHQSYENIQPFRTIEFAEMGLYSGIEFPGFRVKQINAIQPAEALELLGISGLADRKITELSGGERQLAYIARALVQCGETVFLDEPVSNLDPGVAVRIMDALHELNRRGSTIIAVLHNINLASDYCKTIIALKDGKILFAGTPDDVLSYENVEQLYSSVFTVVRNPITGRPFIYSVPGHIR